MRPGIVWIVVQKELKETLRDRKTLFQMLVLPLLVYPLLVLGIVRFQTSTSDARDARPSRVAVWGEVPATLTTTAGEVDPILWLPWEGAPADVRHSLESGDAKAPPAEDKDARPPKRDAKEPAWVEPETPVLLAARAKVERRDVDAVLVPWPGFEETLAQGGEAEASIYFDSVRADSVEARERLERALRRYRASLLSERERGHDLHQGFTAALRITPRNVAGGQRRIADVLSSVMPFLLVLMSLMGAFYPAIDLTAGEKERGTMQTLLCAPVRRIEIIFGKFLAVWTISLLVALANTVSMALTFARILEGKGSVPPSAYALALVLLLPVTFMVSAIFLSVCAFARDFKDGQNLLMPIYLPLSMLASVTVIPGVELDAYTSFVPVVNIALLIKASFLSEATPQLVFLCLLSSGIYAALALVLAARVFEREQVLLSGGSLRIMFRTGVPPHGRGTPDAPFAFTTASAILVIGFYGSLVFTHWGKLATILGVEYGSILAPTLAAVFLGGFGWRATFALRPPSARSLLAAGLTAPSIGMVAIVLVQLVAPAPESFGRALSDAVLLDGRPLWVLILVIGITPAICEELLFRGLVFAGFRRLGAAPAVFLSALLFALAHGSIYRLLPTLSLGLMLGYLRLKSGSIVPGMIVHATNNSLAVAVLASNAAWFSRLIEGPLAPRIGVASVAFAMCAAAILVLRAAPTVLDREAEPVATPAV